MEKKVYVLTDEDGINGDHIVTVYGNEEKAVAEFRKVLADTMLRLVVTEDTYGNNFVECVKEWNAVFDEALSYVRLEEKTVIE